VIDLCRAPTGPPDVSYTAEIGGNNSTVVSMQAASHSEEHGKPSSRNKNSHSSTPGSANKLTDFVKKQGLRSRTRSLDCMKVTDVKNTSTNGLHLNAKRKDTKVGRSRSQSVEREESHKSSTNRSRTHMKLTIPQTPQLLK